MVMKKPDVKTRSQRRPSWRDYQANLQRRRKPGINGRTLIKWVGSTAAGLAAVILIWSWLGHSPSMDAMAPGSAKAAVAPEAPLLKKKDIGLLLGPRPLKVLTNGPLLLPFHDRKVVVQTSLDPDLQQYLIDKMDRRNSRYIGIVVMAANTGRILALAGFDKQNPDHNPCLESSFPAASIFKIVTAAAAIDHNGYTANAKFTFNGFKHTLYKRQIKEQRNRYTNTISLKDAFAQSVNPVFGKIGALYLGKDVLERYAGAFGFNMAPAFELNVAASSLRVDGTPYHWAEIASGFNRDTTISPLHGAMIASAVVNKGRMAEPRLIDRVTDETGDLIYQARARLMPPSISKRSSAELARLMETTIRSGTGRKSFRGYRRDKALRHLTIGGKTGSIYNRRHDERFDWFVGFATDPKGPIRLAVAVMVAHQEYIGIRASRYARMAMTRYFRNRPADQQADAGKARNG